MNDVIKILDTVYDKSDLEKISRGINDLEIKYSNLGNDQTYDLTEKDVVLITYGDQVYSKDQSKLQTLKKLLDEKLKSTISIVHILPFYPYCSDDGFAVIDYYNVNSELGNWDDIEEFSSCYKLLFDAVVNHSSAQCKFFEKFLSEDEEYKDYYFEYQNSKNYDSVVRPRTSPLFHIYEKNGISKSVWTTFSRDQVDFNFKDPKVYLRILDILLFYIQKGANIIRLDAVGFIWKEENTPCIHLPQAHQIIKSYRKIIENLNSSAYLLTETNVPHTENISYFGKGDEAHMVYNFTLPPLLAYSLLSGKMEKLLNWLKNLEVPFSNVCYFNFLASHDGIGLRPVYDILDEEEIDILINAAKANGGEISYKTNQNGKVSPYEINSNYYSLLKGALCQEDIGIKRSIFAHAFLLTMPGLPAIYFHSIFGSENDVEGMKNSGIPRRINREKFDNFELTKKLKSENSRESILLNEIKNLIEIKKSLPAFNPYSNFAVKRINENIILLERFSKNKSSYVKTYYNFSNEQESFTISDSHKHVDLITQNKFEDKITLLPYGFIWVNCSE